MDTAVVIIVATIILAAIAFLAFALFQPQRGPKATEKVDGPRHRWAVQTTLAEMRKEGAGLPSAGQRGSRPKRRPAGSRATEDTGGFPVVAAVGHWAVQSGANLPPEARRSNGPVKHLVLLADAPLEDVRGRDESLVTGPSSPGS